MLDARHARRAALLCGVLAAAAVAGAPFPSLRGQARERPWTRSGKRVALASVEERQARPSGGRTSWLCSARDVRALALAGDTLWIGTEGGLFAMSLTIDAIEPVAGPASPSVRAIAVDGEGALWVGGDRSVSVRSGGRWRHFSGDAHPSFGSVRAIVQGESRLWIGAYGAGAAYVEDDAVIAISSADSVVDTRVLCVAEESPTVIFLGTASGLAYADTAGWRSLRYGSRMPIGAVTCAVFDEEGDLFCAVAEQGVAIYSFGRVRTFAAGPGSPGTEVHALSLDPASRRMWAAGADGVFAFDGTEWTAQPLRGLPSKRSRFLSMTHDAEGICYLGTDDGRVVVATREGAREIAVPQAFPGDRAARARIAGGAVWCIAAGGVYANRGSFSRAAQPPDLYADALTDLLPLESGEIWLTSRFGILRGAGKNWEIFDRVDGLPTEHFIRAARDASGTLWFASYDRGVVSRAGGAWKRHDRSNGLPADDIADLAVDGAGAAWVVTRGGEPARHGEGGWERLPLPRRAAGAERQQADTLQRLDPAIRFLGEPASGAGEASRAFRLGVDRAGACLVASDAGVCRRTAEGWQLIEFPARFAGVRPTAVLGTSRGEIWVGTADRGALVHRAGQWSVIGGANGLSDDHVRSLCEDGKGNVWIATQAGGLTRYAPNGTM